MSVKKIDWVTLTNKHGMKVSVRHERITLLTDMHPLESDVLENKPTKTLVECSDKIKIPVRESREEIMGLMNAIDMLLENPER